MPEVESSGEAGEVWQRGDLFAAMAAHGHAGEHFEELVRGSGLRIERIISRGQVTPADAFYDQPWDEWVLVVQGWAKVRCGEALVELRPGMWLWLPAGCRHRVEATSREPACLWLAVHGAEQVGGASSG